MLDVKTKSQDSIAIIEIDGEVDLYSSPALRKALLEMTKAQNKAILVDLARVKYMDSSGVATLVEGLKAASEGNQAFVLLKPSNSVMKVLELARLDSFFDIRDSLEAG